MNIADRMGSGRMESSISLNNAGASLISQVGPQDVSQVGPQDERFNSSISYFQQALLNVPPYEEKEGYEHAGHQHHTTSIDTQQSSISIQKGTGSSLNNSSYDEGMGEFAHPLFLLSSSCTRTRSTVESTILFNLGLAYASIQDFDEGIRYLRKALRVDREMSIPESLSPSKHAIRHNIGRLHFLAGRHSNAIKVYSRMLVEQHGAQDLPADSFSFSKKNKSLSNNDFFHIAATLNCIAVCRLNSREDVKYPMDKTLQLLRRALFIHDEVLSCIDSIDTSEPIAIANATIINNTGRVLFQLEDFSGALSMYHKAYILRTDLLGNDHIDVAVCFYNMADAHCGLGDDEEAIRGYEKFLSIASIKLGFDHPDIACVLTTLGQLYYKVQDYFGAIKYLTRALKSALRAYGAKNIKLTSIYNLLGEAAFEVGEMDVALKAFQSGLKIEREIGKCEEAIVTTLCNIGETLRLQMKFDEALGSYQEAHEAIEQTKGSCDMLVTVKRKIALIYQKQQRYSDAEREMRAILKLCESMRGERFLQESSRTWNNLALLYYDQSAHRQSLEYFLKSLSLLLHRSSGSCVPELATLYSNIARTSILLDDMDQALHYYKEGYYLEEKEIASFKPGLVLSTLQRIAWVYQEKEEMDKAHKYLIKAATLFLGNEGFMSFEDRSSLQSSFEHYYSNFRVDIGGGNGSKHCAPAA